MGRRKKYHTEEEQRQAKLERWRRWYEKNKEEHNAHRMEKYYEQKNKENGVE